MTAPLLDTALKLLAMGEPSQSDVRRAFAAAYYAMFDHVASVAADLLVGPSAAGFSRARLQIYRSIEHGAAAQQCLAVTLSKADAGFPSSVVVFARTFIDLQRLRIRADYDPSWNCSDSDAFRAIEEAESAIDAFNTVPIPHQRAFCIFLMAKRR